VPVKLPKGGVPGDTCAEAEMEKAKMKANKNRKWTFIICDLRGAILLFPFTATEWRGFLAKPN